MRPRRHCGPDDLPNGKISRLRIHTSTPAAHEWIVTEAVRLIEDGGPLDDASAMRDAADVPSADGRITKRAASLGHRLGLHPELERARRSAPWVGLGIVVLVVVAGLALAGSVTGQADRRINVLAALASLLGVHLVTMAAWIVAVLAPARALPAPRASFGWLWMTLTARVAGGRDGQAPLLLRSGMRLLAKARLLPWTMGIATHAIWVLSFAVVLAAMLFALAFHRYTLGWETTILDADFFVHAVRTLGWLPNRLGFPMPDAATVLSSGGSATEAPDAQHTLAGWLTGCIVVYGLMPRLLALGVCLVVWHARSADLRPDLTQPYYLRLIARFDAMAPAQIVDPDGSVAMTFEGSGATSTADIGTIGDALLIAAYELPPGHDWPSAELGAVVATTQPAPVLLDVDGGAESRRRLIELATRIRPRRLILACRALSSPDRGTERMLRELLPHCGDCRLWLVGEAAEPADTDGRDRWRQWLAATGLQTVTAHDRLTAALQAPAS